MHLKYLQFCKYQPTSEPDSPSEMQLDCHKEDALQKKKKNIKVLKIM